MMPAVHKKGAEEFQDLVNVNLDLSSRCSHPQEGIDMVRLDRLNSTSSSSTRASSILEIEEPACTVDWTDFNYPPYLKIVHFDMDDLPVGEVWRVALSSTTLIARRSSTLLSSCISHFSSL